MPTHVEEPHYYLRKPCFFDDRLIPENATISYNGTPNEEMVPLNEAAREKVRAFFATLKDGKPTDHAQNIFEQVQDRPREAVILEATKPIPVMGTVNIDNRPAPKAATITAKVTAEPSDPGKSVIRVMGTVPSSGPEGVL